MKQDWQQYSERLKAWKYTDEELEEIKKVRENYEPMTFEQFTFLFQQKIVKRKIKLKKPRNLFVSEQGEIFYLNHRNKQYEMMAFFPNENEE